MSVVQGKVPVGNKAQPREVVLSFSRWAAKGTRTDGDRRVCKVNDQRKDGAKFLSFGSGPGYFCPSALCFKIVGIDHSFSHDVVYDFVCGNDVSKNSLEYALCPVAFYLGISRQEDPDYPKVWNYCYDGGKVPAYVQYMSRWQAEWALQNQAKLNGYSRGLRLVRTNREFDLEQCGSKR